MPPIPLLARVLAASLLTAGLAHAQKAAFTGDVKGPVGLPFIVRATEFSGDSADWLSLSPGLAVIDLGELLETKGRPDRVLVFAATPGRYKLRLRAAAVVDGKAVLSDPVVTTVVAGNPPDPDVDPPGPKPPDPPAPPGPNPAPIPDPGFRAMIVFESADLSKLPAAQAAHVLSGPLRTYLTGHCVAEPGGQKAWRFYDKDVDASRDLPVWKTALERVRGKPTPWLIVSNGKAGFEGPLPATVNDTLALLKKYGGE